MPRRINLHQVEAFKAVVERGTVIGAAEMLNISQPAMSRLVAYLEMDTGLKLFDRVKGRLVPTIHGMRLYDEVGRIFAGVRQVENAVEAIRREEQGRLSIGIIPALSGEFIRRVTMSFLERAGGNVFCVFDLASSTQLAEQVIARKLDVGLVNYAVDNPYIVREPLLEHPLICIMPPGHPLAERPVVRVEDLEDTPFLAFSDGDIGMLVQRTLDEHNVQPRIVAVSSIASPICQLVTAGLGVSVVPPLLTSGYEGKLVARRFEPEVRYNFQLCRSVESKNARLIDIFAEEARRTAAQISASMFDG
jgi:DNA-binding transcriptional LysR family regulator